MRVIGHRGAAALAPENTLEAIRAGLAAGAEAAEVDVRLSGDGTLVLLHDATVDRTTDGHGEVAALPARVLRALGIPSLEEAWAVAGGRLVLELKGVWGTDQALDVARATCEFLGGRDVGGAIACSFDVRAIAQVRAAGAGIATGVLTAPAIDAASNIAAALEGGHDWCCLPDAVADTVAVRSAHDAGRSVVVWTVNEPERIRELARLSADGMITDDPAAAAAALHDQ